MEYPIVWLVIGTSLWMAFDAHQIGYDKRHVKGIAAIGPVGWFFAGLLLWIIAFPLYLASRSKLKAAASAIDSAQTRAAERVAEAPRVAEPGQEAIQTEGGMSPLRTKLTNVVGIFVGGGLLLALGWNVILADSAEVQQVKGGSLGACPHATVEQMVDSFMGSPSWDSGTGANGQKFVNVSGDIRLHDKPVRAVVQFILDPAANSFEFGAMEVNGVPQINLVAIGLMYNMCESVESI